MNKHCIALVTMTLEILILCKVLRCSKFQTLVAFHEGLTNSADPDQTSSEEAVWSGSSLFAILTKHFVNFSPE